MSTKHQLILALCQFLPSILLMLCLQDSNLLCLPCLQGNLLDHCDFGGVLIALCREEQVHSAVGRTDFIRFILLTLLSLFSADKMEDMSKMLDPLEDKLRVKKFLTIISRVSL